MKIFKNNLKKAEQPRDCYNFFVFVLIVVIFNLGTLW